MLGDVGLNDPAGWLWGRPDAPSDKQIDCICLTYGPEADATLLEKPAASDLLEIAPTVEVTLAVHGDGLTESTVTANHDVRPGRFFNRDFCRFEFERFDGTTSSEVQPRMDTNKHESGNANE